MADLYIMCGLPGSGKSTFAKELAEKENAIIVSTDSIRQEFYGNEEIQGDTEKVFKKAYIDILNNLNRNNNVIFDATNINFKSRIDIVKRYKKYADKIICVFRATPYEVCLERNSKRDRKVPEQVIRRMYEHFFVPQMYEGFDRIIVDMEIEHLNYYAWEQLQDISQDNPYHTLTVLEHCKETLRQLKSANIYLRLAALYHDIGKLKTKSFDNKHNDVEIWKDIIEFQSRYEISNFGNVRNKKTQRILKPREHSGGYLQINVINNGKAKNYYVHQLVAKYFCDIPKDIKNKDVNHIDGNKKNNFYKNLEYCTRSENIRHSFYTNKNRNRFGEQVWNSKLNSKDIENINKIKKEQKLSNKKIAEMYNISESQITRVLNKKTYVNKIESQVKEISPILPQKYASFYNHENVGAYDILFYRDIGEKVSDRLKVSQYIQWHMLPYVTMSERKKEYYHNLLRDEFYQNIMILNDADVNAK